MAYALITGASSGIGRDIARILKQKGFDLILVSRNINDLQNLKNEFKKGPIEIISCDLSDLNSTFNLLEQIKDYDIEILINNAGYGIHGNFSKIEIEKELNMVNLNCLAPQILLKHFVNFFKDKENCYILNVCSSASFFSGPLMGTYYATKNYLYSLSLAVYQELKEEGSKINLSVLCPGPVKTNFWNVANVNFQVKPISSEKVAKIAVRKMFAKKLIIIPEFKMKMAKFFSRFISEKRLLKIVYKAQKSKKD